MKVRLNNKIHRFGYDGKRYLPGDVFEVPAELFRSDIMVEIKEAPPVLAAPTITIAPEPVKVTVKKSRVKTVPSQVIVEDSVESV